LAELIVYVDPDAVGGGTGVDWTNAYASLSIMEAAEQDDFDTANNWLHVYCRSSSSTADTTNLEINGSITSSDDYIKIEGASGHRAKKTSWDASIYRLAPAASNTVNVYDNHVWFDGIQFACPTTGIYTGNISAGSWTFISNCRNNGSSTWLAPNDSDGTMYIWNCINTGGGRLLDFNAGTAYVYNSIAYGSSQDGIRFIVGSSGAIYNTVSFKNSDDFDFHGGITVDHCASDDGDGTNDVAESGGGVEWPDDFVDAANGDFTLKATSNLVGAGVADPGSGLFSTDIDGDTYATPPSLGVDEIAASGAAWIPRVMIF